MYVHRERESRVGVYEGVLIKGWCGCHWSRRLATNQTSLWWMSCHVSIQLSAPIMWQGNPLTPWNDDIDDTWQNDDIVTRKSANNDTVEMNNTYNIIHIYTVFIDIYIYFLPVMYQGLWLVSWPGCTISYDGVNLVCWAKPQTSQCYDNTIVTSQRNLRHTRLVKDSWPICSLNFGHHIVQIYD